MAKIIQQGAEAKIILSDDFIIKDRIKKSYRIPEIDNKIRRRRTKSEAKLLKKASELIDSPCPLLQPSIKNSTKIKIPFIDGKKLSEHLDSFSLVEQKKICEKIGKNIAILHDNDIVHGDLTTSNMILKKDKVYFIDFGLGFISDKTEDKAVDLHLLKKALMTKHYRIFEKSFENVLKGYKENKDFKEVLNRLEKVESRGRYKRKAK